MTVTEVLLPIKHTTHITGNVTEDTHGYIVLVTEYDCHWSDITNPKQLRNRSNAWKVKPTEESVDGQE